MSILHNCHAVQAYTEGPLLKKSYVFSNNKLPHKQELEQQLVWY
jgi:hypothetical protein